MVPGDFERTNRIPKQMPEVGRRKRGAVATRGKAISEGSCRVPRRPRELTLFTLEIENTMNDRSTETRGKEMAKHWLFSAFLVTFFSFAYAHGDQTVYQDGPFRVRQAGETCKLEIFLESKALDKERSSFWKHDFTSETVGFFSVFKTDDYFGELITEKARVGMAKGRFSVKFDGVTDASVVSSDSTGEDNLWQWRHFSYGDTILARIRKSRMMEVAFSNGQDMFHFNLSLTGSSKAVRHLQNCKGK